MNAWRTLALAAALLGCGGDGEDAAAADAAPNDAAPNDAAPNDAAPNDAAPDGAAARNAALENATARATALRLVAVARRAAMAAAAVAQAHPKKVTLMLDKCMASLVLSGKEVYTRKPRQRACSGEWTITVPVPRTGAHTVTTRKWAYYANGGIWALHEDTFLVPLVGGEVYEVGEDHLAKVVRPRDNDTRHCVIVTSDHERYDAFLLRDFHLKSERFAMGSPLLSQPRHRRQWLVLDEATEFYFGKLEADYRILHPGTYKFHVTRKGEVRLSFDPVDACSP